MNASHLIENYLQGRRQFLRTLGFGAACGLIATPGLFAEALTRTPTLTEGPFYPDKLPLDTDNDLLIINDSIHPGVGEVTHMTGKIMTSTGKPVRNAFVEIWQVDSLGSYLHKGGRSEKFDSNFQGYGRFVTGMDGGYYFRTIKPVPYPGRTPHVHVAVSMNGKRVFTTQMLIKGEPMNEKDGVFKQVTDAKQRESIMAEFKPLEGSKIGELTANFDIVLGKTLEELPNGQLGIGERNWKR